MAVGSSTLSQLKKLAKVSPDIFAAALFQEGQIELKEIKQVTPVDTGALRASEKLSKPERDGRRVFVTISAGGPSVPYAAVVHYDLEAFHPVGQALYIEQPLREAMPFIPERIAARINAEYRTFFVDRVASAASSTVQGGSGDVG